VTNALVATDVQQEESMLMMSHLLSMLMLQKIIKIIYIELAELQEQALLELW
jgi:hypothetical protein